MIFNQHSNLKGQHAFLGASKYHWVRYSDDKLIQTYLNSLAAEKGTELHDLAGKLISLKVRLPKNNQTLNAYVNDAIAFKMVPEQVLYYSPFCFGTADAICYDEKKKFLRIHDLKTGQLPVHIEQLEIYAALFYLEYGELYFFEPKDDNIELRIYWCDQIITHHPESSVICELANKIVIFSEMLEKIKNEEK